MCFFLIKFLNSIIPVSQIPEYFLTDFLIVLWFCGLSHFIIPLSFKACRGKKKGKKMHLVDRGPWRFLPGRGKESEKDNKGKKMVNSELPFLEIFLHVGLGSIQILWGFGV